MTDFVQIPTPKDLDIISHLKFSQQNQLLVSSWDNRLLLYDCNEVPKQLHEFNTQDVMLNVQYLGNQAFCGGLDGNIYSLDYENLKLVNENLTASTPKDNKDCGVNNLITIGGQDHVLVSSTFDNQLQVNDVRLKTPIMTKHTDKKILKMDATSTFVTLGMSQRTVEIYDHRNWSTPYQIRESGLKLQINDLKCFPNEEGFTIAGIDGRVSVEYFDPAPQVQANKYAFKCHRALDPITKIDVAYPVNSIIFNANSNMLYTGGSDGILNVWNWQQRKRAKQYPKLSYNQAISSMDFNHDYSLLAVATSDDSYKNQMSIQGTVPKSTSSVFVGRDVP